MSFLIVSQDNQVYKIAENETDKNNLNCSYPPYKVVSISDSDFNKIKIHIADVNYVNDSFSIVDKIENETHYSSETLQNYHNGLKKNLEQFMQSNSSSHVFYTRVNNYFNLLNTFNYSNIQFPLNSSWETYCEQNSIEFLSPLQIP
jgi:uncharacterized protein YktA (UPF0223 family)